MCRGRVCIKVARAYNFLPSLVRIYPPPLGVFYRGVKMVLGGGVKNRGALRAPPLPSFTPLRYFVLCACPQTLPFSTFWRLPPPLQNWPVAPLFNNVGVSIFESHFQHNWYRKGEREGKQERECALRPCAA